ncbi:hypothetical protein SVIOM342S_03181 [Streptomyces violaceorubidus]
MSEHVSTVVNRREAVRALAAPADRRAVVGLRLSTTRLSGCLQKGQCMDSEPSSQQTQQPRKALQAPRSSPQHRRSRRARRPGGPQLVGCSRYPTTRCRGLAHTYTPCTRVAPVRARPPWPLHASHGRVAAASPGGMRRYRGHRGEGTWGYRNRWETRAVERDAGWQTERHPGGRHHGGEEYSNEPFCPPSATVAIHPDMQDERAIRVFSLERVFGATFRKLLPLCSRETIERGRRDHHRRQSHHHCPGTPPGPT